MTRPSPLATARDQEGNDQDDVRDVQEEHPDRGGKVSGGKREDPPGIHVLLQRTVALTGVELIELVIAARQTNLS
ncbi:hypothetical protein NG819_02970 [Pseudarthrobacter sp. Fe7]|nr:hypothetical protein NG819_02970 [Pseudarthrobacter sp. Fe7]